MFPVRRPGGVVSPGVPKKHDGNTYHSFKKKGKNYNEELNTVIQK
jgi:hypothetical protein